MVCFIWRINMKRELWVDSVKIYACILVVLGHLFQSMTKTGLMGASNLYLWFNQTIYYFHVPLFFLCSGYLYQKHSKIDSFLTWKKYLHKKLYSLGIPYITFTTITFFLKKIFENSVNDQSTEYLSTLFLNPIAPYWYLYVLFFLFTVIPTVQNENKLKLFLGLSMLSKIAMEAFGEILPMPYLLSGILNQSVWFVSGMYLTIPKMNPWSHKKSSILGILFLLVSILFYKNNITFVGMELFLGCLACFTIAAFFRSYDQRKKTSTYELSTKIILFFSNYTFSIFLMHTIFAAGIRSILLKIGVTNIILHSVFGLLSSLVFPIITSWFIGQLTLYLSSFFFSQVKINRNLKE